MDRLIAFAALAVANGSLINNTRRENYTEWLHSDALQRAGGDLTYLVFYNVVARVPYVKGICLYVYTNFQQTECRDRIIVNNVQGEKIIQKAPVAVSRSLLSDVPVFILKILIRFRSTSFLRESNYGGVC